METIRISQLSEANSLDDLHTIGIDGDNRSVKVSLDYIKTQVDIVNEADAAAVFANIAADNAREATADAREATGEVLEVVNAANEVVTKTMAVPTIDIRLIRNRDSHRSIYFPNEDAMNIVDKLQYRINGLPEQINAFRLEGWQINLLRPRWVHGSKRLHYKKWATCEVGRSQMGSVSYPTREFFKLNTCRDAGAIWCGENVNNLGRIDIPEGYNGEWLDFGNDFLEKLIRRYVYIQQLYFGYNTMQIAPLSCFSPYYIPPDRRDDLQDYNGGDLQDNEDDNLTPPPSYSPVVIDNGGGGRPSGVEYWTTVNGNPGTIVPRPDGGGSNPGEPETTFEPLPLSTPDVVFIRIAGHRRRQCIYGKYKQADGNTSKTQNLMEVTGQAKYISLPFALALSKNIDGKHNYLTTGENTNYEKRIDGPRTYFTAIFRRIENTGVFQYTAKISGLGTPKTSSKAKE